MVEGGSIKRFLAKTSRLIWLVKELFFWAIILKRFKPPLKLPGKSQGGVPIHDQPVGPH